MANGLCISEKANKVAATTTTTTTTSTATSTPSTSNSARGTRAKRKALPSNPLQAGILTFFGRIDHKAADVQLLTAESLPKRYTLYPPALFLPENFAHHSQAWRSVYEEGLDEDAKQALFASIAEIFRQRGYDVSRIAITAAIPSFVGPDDHHDNILRSPCQLLPVYGDFGPASLGESTVAAGPTKADFDAAFWLSTSQHAGISQIWAPRWTMFSRGNVGEKARILTRDGDGDHHFPGMTESELGTPLDEAEVVDLYVGIGYFAFSYLKSNVKRVWGWDLNPWSIEGLRRGCEKNGWRYLVVQLTHGDERQKQALSTSHQSPYGGIGMEPDAKTVASIIAEGDRGSAFERVRCVAFLGSNEWATVALCNIAAHLKKLQALTASNSTTSQSCSVDISPSITIRHVNLGLLPSSRDSWETAIGLASKDSASWLHVHENVNAKAIDQRAGEVASEISSIMRGSRDKRNWTASCEHIEQVKSFGPGVVHCVFDIRLTPPSPSTTTTERETEKAAIAAS